MNPKLREVGLELDTSLKFKDITEKLKSGHVPAKVTAELAAAAKPGASVLTGTDAAAAAFRTPGTLESLLEVASIMAPEARVHGLKAIKAALGC